MLLTDGTVHDVKIMDYLCNESGVIYTMDRGYNDYNSLYNIELHDSWFVTRMKTNCVHEELSVFAESATEKMRLDADILLTGKKRMKEYPVVLRKVCYHDDEAGRDYVFLTNNFEHTAQEIADIYKTRWQIELFFNGL
jgi:IS4 transposase